MEEEKKRISRQSAILTLTVVLLAALAVVLLISTYSNEVIRFGDKEVKAEKCMTFENYVEKLNEIHYSDNKVLLDESIPEFVIYKDSLGNSYIMALDKDMAIEKLNELRYSSEYKVQSKYLTLRVFYY